MHSDESSLQSESNCLRGGGEDVKSSSDMEVVLLVVPVLLTGPMLRGLSYAPRRPCVMGVNQARHPFAGTRGSQTQVCLRLLPGAQVVHNNSVAIYSDPPMNGLGCIDNTLYAIEAVRQG